MENMEIKNNIKSFLNTVPDVIDVIAYGSAVKEQTGYSEKDVKQIDLIATVKDSLTWLKENQNNYSSSYNRFATKLIYPILHFGTDISYVCNMNFEGNTYKVGVVDKIDLLHDLYNWNNFYLAGRTQKPITIIEGDETLEKAIAKNRLNALRTTLILSCDKVIYERELFEALCSLSYIGDVRTILEFENPNKVRNIVNGRLNEFKDMYNEINDDLYHTENGIVIPNIRKLLNEANELPSCLIKFLVANNIEIGNLSPKDINKLNEYIIEYIRKVNFKSSAAQGLKGAALNNPNNIIKYLEEKKKKSKIKTKTF